MTIPTEVAATRKPAGVIETHHTDRPTEWGYSFTSHNPGPADYVRCYDEESAWKLAQRLESALTKAEAVAWMLVSKSGATDPYRTEEACRRDAELIGGSVRPLVFGDTHAPPAVSGRKPLSETMYRGPAHPEGHREQLLDRRCLAADNAPAVPVESLGRDAEPDALSRLQDACFEAIATEYRTGQFNRADVLMLLSAAAELKPAEPPSSAPDGLIRPAGFNESAHVTVMTYTCQPGNVEASRLGEARAKSEPGGDYIDGGLSLLRELHARGYGIVRVFPPTNQEGAAP